VLVSNKLFIAGGLAARMLTSHFFLFFFFQQDPKLSLTQQTHTLTAQRKQRKRGGYRRCLGVGDTEQGGSGAQALHDAALALEAAGA